MAQGKRTGFERRRDRRPDCVFCRIVAGEAPVSKVFEDARTLAFMDVNPVRRGHVLVIPKAHRAQVWDMRDSIRRRVPASAQPRAGTRPGDAGRCGGRVEPERSRWRPDGVSRALSPDPHPSQAPAAPAQRPPRHLRLHARDRDSRAASPYRLPHTRGCRGLECASREGQAGLRRATAQEGSYGPGVLNRPALTGRRGGSGTPGPRGSSPRAAPDAAHGRRPSPPREWPAAAAERTRPRRLAAPADRPRPRSTAWGR